MSQFMHLKFDQKFFADLKSCSFVKSLLKYPSLVMRYGICVLGKVILNVYVQLSSGTRWLTCADPEGGGGGQGVWTHHPHP